MTRLEWAGYDGSELTPGTKIKIEYYGREELANVERVHSDGTYRVKLCSLFERMIITSDKFLEVQKLVRE
jgi:hypothetical protein